MLVMGRGEEASGGGERSSNLANCFEAIVGATVLDRGIESPLGRVPAAIAEAHQVQAGQPGTLRELAPQRAELLRIRDLHGVEDDEERTSVDANAAAIVERWRASTSGQ